MQCPICQPCDISKKILSEPQHPRKMGPEYLPPSPPQELSQKEELAVEERMKDKIKKGLKISGYLITAASLGQPFYMFWGTGNFMHTTKLYSEVNTACVALTSYGWLLYGIIQVSYKDLKEIKGVDAIVMNAISWAVSAFLFTILLLCAREEMGKACICILAGYVVLTLFALHFPIVNWVDKKSPTKIIIGIVAGVCQGLSELIPIVNLLKIWWTAVPNQQYDVIRHYKKFIIISRAVDSIVTSYWMLYCVFTYQFDAFGIGNIACASLSLVSFVLHSAWAVKPI